MEIVFTYTIVGDEVEIEFRGNRVNYADTWFSGKLDEYELQDLCELLLEDIKDNFDEEEVFEVYAVYLKTFSDARKLYDKENNDWYEHNEPEYKNAYYEKGE